MVRMSAPLHRPLALLVAAVIIVCTIGASTQSVQAIDDISLSIALGQRLQTLAFDRGGNEFFGRDPYLSKLDAIMRRLAVAAKGQRDLPYRLVVLSSPVEDAWPYSDGSVYITVGLLRALDTYDEAAAIIAHQMAHAALNHHLADVQTAEMVSTLRQVALGSIAPSPYIFGKSGIVILAQSFLPSMEHEADALADRILSASGFKQASIAAAHRRLLTNARSTRYFQCHPHVGLEPYPSSVRRNGDLSADIDVTVIVRKDISNGGSGDGQSDSSGTSESRSQSRTAGLEVGGAFGAIPIARDAADVTMEYLDIYQDTTGQYLLDLDLGAISGAKYMSFTGSVRLGSSFELAGGIGFPVLEKASGSEDSRSAFLGEGGVFVRSGSGASGVKVGLIIGGISYQSSILGGVPRPHNASDSEFIMVDGNIIEHGSPLWLKQGCFYSGLAASASIPMIGDRLFFEASAAYRVTLLSSFTLESSSTGDGVTTKWVVIPFEETGGRVPPLSVTGASFTVGLRFVF